MIAIAAILALVASASAADFPTPPCYIFGDLKIEAPCSLTVANNSDYSVRVYGASAGAEYWSTAAVTGSYSDAQGKGFGKNFAYISGDNSKSAKIPMTHPVLARGNGTDPTSWQISFFVPSAFSKSAAEVPTPNDSDVVIQRAPLVKVALGEFPGFATEELFNECETKLKAALARDGVKTVTGTDWSRTWASYDSPFTLFNRHNECWLRVE